ncbi:MAG: site-specific integrase [Sulfurimonas sp.]|nr:site-specific integrase [Sulfurimonas sp.]
MLAYTFVRPVNIRLALWSEINLKAKQWVIPSKKMKTRDEFIIPLTDTLIKLLKEIKLYAGDSPYLFPSTKSKTTPLSDGALLGAIRRMGYTKEEFTPHGFRAMFSTITHEKSPFKYDVIETQLAHNIGNSVSQAYNRAKYLDERVQLMQWWSDYIDEVQR